METLDFFKSILCDRILLQRSSARAILRVRFFFECRLDMANRHCDSSVTNELIERIASLLQIWDNEPRKIAIFLRYFGKFADYP